jgi:hypothetical protein
LVRLSAAPPGDDQPAPAPSALSDERSDDR